MSTHGGPAPGAGTISDITSATLTITNPTGPTANVDGPLLANLAAGGFKITGLANGTVATDAAAFGQLPAAYPLSSPLSGQNAIDVLVSASSTVTLVTTGSLAVGTWLITFGTDVFGSTLATGNCEIEAAVGTATATFSGKKALTVAAENFSLGSNGPFCVGLAFLAVVTVTGTVIIKATNDDSSWSYAFRAATSPTADYAGATGWTATRVA